MKLTLAFPLLALALGGCRSKEDVPYLGRWEGSFTVSKLVGKALIPIAGRNNWKGYVILYRTQDRAADGSMLGNRCQMHMANEQESIDVNGHWLVHRNQISIGFKKLKIDDAGGLDERDPNKAYIEPTEIDRAFATPLILNSNRKKNELQSPLVILGPLEGSYRFDKTALGR
jgi:hypothetical protein